MLGKAKELETRLDWEGALSEYRLALANKPDSVEILDKIGWCQSRQGLYNDAAMSYKKISSIEPYKAKWYYMVGFQYYSEQNWTDAIEWFRKALARYPRYFKVKYRLAYALTKQSGAVYRLRKPEYLEAYRLLEECVAEWETLSDVDKEREKTTFADIYFQKGKIHCEKSEWKSAIICFNNALNLKPGEFDYKYQLSKALLMDNQPEIALKTLPPENGKYYVRELKASLYHAVGDTEQALDILQKELQRRKRDYIFREIAEIHLKKKNDTKLAYNNIQKAISLNPQNHFNHLTLAEVYCFVGLLNAALKEAQLAIELKVKNYGSSFSEAEATKNRIMSLMIELKHEQDDENALASLLGTQDATKETMGLIKSYKPDKGFGFIETPTQDIFFHITEVNKVQQALVKVGKRVLFRTEQALKGPTAKDVKLINN